MITYREQLAQLLDGRQYRDEIGTALEAEAKENGVIVVFGASDDLVEFRGAISDEEYGPGDVPITRDGLLESKCDEGADCPYFREIEKAASTIEALWCAEKGGPSWTYKTDIPHSTFVIFEDGEAYCRGIVFALADVKAEVSS